MNATSVNDTYSAFQTCKERETILNFSVAAQHFYLAVAVFCSFASVVTCATNVGFIVAMTKQKHQITIGQKLLIVLSAEDLIQGLTVWPAQSYFHFMKFRGVLDCLLVRILGSLGYGLSWITALTLFLITSEQYVYIAYPYAYERTMRFSKLLLVILIPGSCSLVAGAVLNIWICQKQYWVLYKVTLATGGVLLVLAIGVLQAHITVIANRVRKRIGLHYAAEAEAMRQKAKARKAATTILMAFIIAYMPFCFYYIYAALHKEDSLFSGTYVKPIVELLAISNSMVNPVVYYWRSVSVRQAIRQLIGVPTNRVGGGEIS